MSPVPVITMGPGGVVVGVLALVSVAWATVGGNNQVGERVVLVSPVLAPPRDSKKHVTDRARQFPVLVLLQQGETGRAEQAKSLETNPQPIYVQVS